MTNVQSLQVARCSLNPYDLGLTGFECGENYLFEEFVDSGLVTVYWPRLNKIRGIDAFTVREAGTIRRLDFRAFFSVNGETGADYCRN